MRKFATLVVLAISILSISAMPAQAASLRVSAKAAARTNRIDVSAKVSRPSRVKVSVYEAGRKIRTVTAKKRGSSYKASVAGVSAGVYTFTVSATSAMKTAKRTGTVTVPTSPIPTAPSPAPATGISTPTGVPSRWIGFFQQGTPSSMTPLTTLETAINAHSGVVNWYASDSESFPLAKIQSVRDHGSVPMITMEFWSTQTGGVATIANGSKDAYLGAWADAAKSYGGEVWIRPLHEMNGNWYPWSGTTNGNSPAQVVAAWKHIHDVFVAHGATNVKFVWCVNNDNVPNTTANAIGAYWPGDAYVDSIAIDGYNWGTTQSWSTWRSFSSVVGAAYSKVTALSSKPVFLAEVGCPEQGGSKAAWIADMFKQISTNYTRIQGVCWFNVDSRTTQNSDWRVDSSATSVSAFKAAVANGF